MAPEDLESRGPDAIALFFRALKEGRKFFQRSRLFLTGPARGGKTSLKRALMGQMFNAQEESTIGVECDLHVCVMEKGQKTAWKVTFLWLGNSPFGLVTVFGKSWRHFKYKV